MEEGFLIRFVLQCDTKWSQSETRDHLHDMLSKALRREPTTQDGYPECDFYIEGSVQWWTGATIIRLFLCDMGHRIVRIPLRMQFTDRADDDIAQLCNNELWARFSQLTNPRGVPI